MVFEMVRGGRRNLDQDEMMKDDQPPPPSHNHHISSPILMLLSGGYTKPLSGETIGERDEMVDG